MTCPKCGTFEARIYRTMLGTHVNRREQRCRCGIGWQLVERIDKGSVRPWFKPGENQGEMTLGARNGHAVKRAAQSSGDRDPSLDISSSPLSSDPNASSPVLGKPRARVGKRGRPSTQEYSSDFEQFWGSITIKRGNKQPAFDAWVKKTAGISPELIFTRYGQWSATAQWQDGFAPYVATWLNQKGWENEPGSVEFKRRGASAKTDGNIDELGDWLARRSG